ncbi:disks large homolog 4-like [Watersipora subatra]|uniref:disks large homolog 4-like n=1 Tax=Watersipora subatra TaxID=2589382 RepID=UPI00355AF3AF
MDAGDGSEDIIEIVLHRKDEGLGFNIRGGIDMPHISEDVGIFVTKVREVGAAALDGRLAEGDKILKLNDTSLMEVTHQTAVYLFKSAGNVVKLTVLKNAEKKAVEAAVKRKSDAANRLKEQEVKPKTTLLGLGAVSTLAIVLGIIVYSRRHSIKDFFSQLLLGTDRYNALNYRPYRY